MENICKAEGFSKQTWEAIGQTFCESRLKQANQIFWRLLSGTLL